MAYIWIVLAGLILVAGVGYRLRIRKEVGNGHDSLTDDLVRRIEATGRLELEDDALDMEEIERAEDEFWEDSWDDPESWQR